MAARKGGRPPATPWALYIRDRVREGPQLRSTLIRDAGRLIPPGRAFRRGIANANYVRAHRGRGEMDTDAMTHDEVDRAIRVGAANIIAVVLTTMMRSGRIATIEGNDGTYVILGDKPWN